MLLEGELNENNVLLKECLEIDSVTSAHQTEPWSKFLCHGVTHDGIQKDRNAKVESKMCIFVHKRKGLSSVFASELSAGDLELVAWRTIFKDTAAAQTAIFRILADLIIRTHIHSNIG